MSKNKEEIRYILKFYYKKKRKNATQRFVATWFNNKKFNGSNFHLRIIAKMEQNRTIFETAHYGRWKMDDVRQ